MRFVGIRMKTACFNFICYAVNSSYKGHVPTIKFDYGETYGNHTARYFQDFRLHALDTSQSNYSRGGYFPSYYSNNGNLAVEARTRTDDRWLHNPNYRLSNVDHDRQEHLGQFQKVGLYLYHGTCFTGVCAKYTINCLYVNA
jgi:hypothetical protein